MSFPAGFYPKSFEPCIRAPICLHWDKKRGRSRAATFSEGLLAPFSAVDTARNSRTILSPGDGTVLQYLAAAGVGTLGIVDDYHVSLSNLQRQIIHDTDQVGELKTQSAKHALGRINPHVDVETWPIRLTSQNGYALVSQYDLVIDGCDNFKTRYAVADICAEARKPLITGAVGQFDGSVTMLKPYEQDSDGKPNPGYRDIFPNPPEDGTVPTCAETGILGALTGVIGSMLALEAIKEITDTGQSLVGRLVLYDAKSVRFEEFSF